MASRHRCGDVNNPLHIVVLEVLIEEWGEFTEGEATAYVKQMRMDLYIRCSER